jgi:hypothetical protein
MFMNQALGLTNFLGWQRPKTIQAAKGRPSGK